MVRHYCTYFDKTYLLKGLALIRSLIRHEPEPFRVYVVCLDELTQTVLNSLNISEIITIPLATIEAGDADLAFAMTNRTRVEYFWTMTPTIIMRILRKLNPGDVLTYLDADLFFFSSPQPIFDEFGEDAVLIHGHRFPPFLKQLEIHGIYNVGLLSFRYVSEGLEVLEWWRQRCNEWCYDRVEDGKYGDQAYLDDWPARFLRVHVLQHVGAGVAPWNNIQYQFAKAVGDAPPRVDGRELIFYHFHAFEFYCPTVAIVSKHHHYPLHEAVLSCCYLPYLLAINEAIQQVRHLMPDFSEGMFKDTAFQPYLTFMTPRASAQILAGAAIDHRIVPLDDTWDCYCSSQVIAESDMGMGSATADNLADVVVIATSIAPKNVDKQLAAVESWIRVGFRVISVNTAEEILKLQDIFPMVTFETATETGRGHFGNSLIYIDDILKSLLKSGSKICGIINSDIVLHDCHDLPEFLKKYIPHTLIYGKRVDVDELGSTQGPTYCYGRDYFFFDAALISKIPKSSFCLGAPWWDIWIPLAAKHAGFNLIQPLERLALHKKHPTAWNILNYIVSFSILNDLMFRHEYEITKDSRFFDAAKELVHNKSDSAIMLLLLDYLAENTLVYSIKLPLHQGLIIYDNLSVVSKPEITFVLTDRIIDAESMVHALLSIERRNYFKLVDIVVLLTDKSRFELLRDCVITMRNQYGNISFVLSAADPMVEEAIVKAIARGKCICKVDELQQVGAATCGSGAVLAAHGFEPLNQLLSHLENAYGCE